MIDSLWISCLTSAKARSQHSLVTLVILGVDFLQQYSLLLNFASSPGLYSDQQTHPLGGADSRGHPNCTQPIIAAEHHLKTCTAAVAAVEEPGDDAINEYATQNFQDTMNCVMAECTLALKLLLEQHKHLFVLSPGLLEVPCVQEVLVIGPDKPGGTKRHFTNTGVNIRPMHASHLVPSMGPIVSLMTSHGQQNQLQKADQSARPVNATVHRQCMSVAISWANKMEQGNCDISVGFPISSQKFHMGQCFTKLKLTKVFLVIQLASSFVLTYTLLSAFIKLKRVEPCYFFDNEIFQIYGTSKGTCPICTASVETI